MPTAERPQTGHAETGGPNTGRPKTGRPRQFDPDAVLDAAARLFWEHGYEATSMKMLLEATGLSSASFYGAHSSKKALFDAALGRYATTFGHQATSALADPALSPRAAVAKALTDSVRMQTDSSHPLGCLVTLSGTLASDDAENTGAAAYRAGTRHQYADLIRAAIGIGELSPDTDAVALATVFECMQWGIATDARDGVARSVLLSAADTVMSVWDAHRPVDR